MAFRVWLTFFIANLLLSLSPGPGALAAVNAGASHGARAGWKLVMGLQVALLIELSIVALGAGVLLTASATAFAVLRWVGALYLIWLGVRQLLLAWRPPAEPEQDARPVYARHELFWRGVLVNLTNPKSHVFMAALLPQFISPVEPLLPQYLTIAATMCGIDTLVMGGYALLASRLSVWLHEPHLVRWRNGLFGVAFIIFGLLLFAVERVQ